MATTMVQGYYEDNKAHVAMKGNGKECAILIGELINQMAEGLHTSFEETVTYVAKMHGTGMSEPQQVKVPETVNDEVAGFFKRREEPTTRPAVQQMSVPQKAEEELKAEKYVEFLEWQKQQEQAKTSAVLEPVEGDEPVFTLAEEYAEEVVPESEPILNILVRHHIDSVFERKVEHSLPDAKWFDSEYQPENGKYYLLLENKNAQSAKEKMRISSAMRINGKWALSTSSKLSLSNCNVIAYTERA